MFRPELFYEMCSALESYDLGTFTALDDAAWSVREKTRRVGRHLRHRTVGSTLLVKGLEFDHALILDADVLRRKELYVALTRGARSLTVISSESTLSPS